MIERKNKIFGIKVRNPKPLKGKPSFRNVAGYRE
jgi:hypothetical protein